MNELEDIAEVKRRFGVLEDELDELKRKLASVEAAVIKCFESAVCLRA
jgi:hypothetical protein